MKPYLVDLPVRVQLWIRPHLLRKQFEVIKQARPSVLFLISDGGRTEKEQDLIAESRKIFEEIDWECTVHKLFMEENQGLYTMGKLARDFIWDKVDRCYFLEDDYVPSVDAFRFCAELLEKYKDDLRIAGICTTNLCGVWEPAEADYFFSSICSIWGIAYWKRSMISRELSYKESPYIIRCINANKYVPNGFLKNFNGYIRDEKYGGHVAGGEFFNDLNIYLHNQLFIFPKKNLISNHGCGDDAEHSAKYKFLPRRKKKLFYSKTYTYNFPLNHPKYLVADTEFRKSHKKMLCDGYPFLEFCDKLETVFLRIIHGDFKTLFKKLKFKLSGKKKIEN